MDKGLRLIDLPLVYMNVIFVVINFNCDMYI